MKLKRRPEDFQVEELSDFGADGGPFALYRLTKRSLGTPEAVTAVLRRWKIPRHRVSYGGLKDRHAITHQFVTIQGGPRRDLAQTNLELVYQGQASRPFGPRDIAGNRFQITLRDVSPDDRERLERQLAALVREGLPNYFDDQRFGSVGESGEFVARAWCAGQYERALWLALADPHPYDRPGERAQKRLLREHWGDWALCQERLGRSHRRSVVTYLAARPEDFRGAIARLRVDLRGLYLSAFQSDLWNQVLAAFLRQTCRDEQLVPVGTDSGPLPFYHDLEPAQAASLSAARLPLPSARTKIADAATRRLVEEVLAGEGLELRALRVKYPRDSFFSKGDRAAVFFPAGLRHAGADDELYAGRTRLTLGFDLPRGCYATLVIKRLSASGP
ncbi:MAG TPA: tRNA pseudouridine(13) synthase TruD [Planctomycetaceae bacterium]|nr:tRNA pseudouridine(13) synthase TruD [Planctomycetaceae bacterium]